MAQFMGIDVTKINLTTRDLMREACRTSRDKTFIVYVPTQAEITFGEFEANVNRISNLFASKYGIKQGDKVCTMSGNAPELLYVIMAITNLGAVWVPINSMLIGESLRYIIEASDAAYVCGSEPFRDDILGILEKAAQPVRLLMIEDMAAEAKEQSTHFDCPAGPNDLSMIMFTSGTTGFPKGVMHTHNTYIRTAVRGLEALETGETHRIHVFLPFFHGWAYLLLLGTLYHKCTMILEDRFHADKYWETVDKYRITQDHWTGTVPLNLMKLPETELEKKAGFGIIGTFGALYASMKERWPNLRFQSLYGQTEHPFITEVPPDQVFPGSDGIPKYPDEIMILDNEGNLVAQGEIGEIVCKCFCGVLMKGYYKNPEATAKTLKDGAIFTGDLGFLDEKGHLHFAGRKKDALRVRGEMVSVEHIEHLVNKHEKIAECAIVGYRPPDKVALKEDEIVVHLILRQGESLSPGNFMAWAEQNLAKFMRPRYLKFRKAFPKTATERVQKYKLREEGIDGATKLY